ncbi:hypothetical protein M407DRAFT_27936 [Tulasnella calospora MUT 4182]|uniref:F-box domain-containing protein n=1 Tax=Tulasnella calospora MUT 4182 TaxID=1051891 RepID=A0A0C3QBK8_9AGAM|nr:hypothetical protein M407DRAFT_27936 [Tulasnella calospora MUT 4182]
MNQIDTVGRDSPGCDAIMMTGGHVNVRELKNSVENQVRRLEAHALSELDLRIKQNAELPIHSLPPELLLEVISLHMLLHLENFGMGYYRRLIGLSGVCSRWYNVIRDSPSLWTQIYVSDSSEVVKIALQRSSSHLLDISLRHTVSTEELPEHFQFFMNAVHCHRDRWRSMKILVPARRMGDVLAVLGEPAPNLKTLLLIDGDTMYCTRKFDLFGGKAPRLTSLTLDGVSIQWDSEIIHNLTALDLSWINFPSTDAILHALSNCAQLQTLKISNCTTTKMATPSSPIIQLPHFSSLYLHLGPQSATENFRDHIGDDRYDAPSLLLSRLKQRRGTCGAHGASVDAREGALTR